MIIKPPEVEFGGFSISDVPCNPEPFRLINRIPIRDVGEPLVDLRETNPELSFGVYCLPYVRESVAEALQIAFRNTPEHLDLRIFTALRTLEQQAEMYWHNYRKAKEEHPGWSEAVVRRMTNRFFAPPDAKAPPGHCTGGAVDVGLLDRATGEGIDLRSPLEGWKGAPTASSGLSEEAARNRRLLCYIMHSTGLSNCRDEFWHWSYGDSAWAVRVGADTAWYGLIEAPAGATRVTGPKVALVPYDPSWSGQFDQVRRAIEPTVAARFEHVGSTAVPGLAAQPMIDIDVAVSDEGAHLTTAEALERLEYVREGEHFRPKADRDTQTAHRLRLLTLGNAELAHDLAVRDLLRSHPAIATEYGALKTALAARYPWDRIRYDAQKRAFLDERLQAGG